MVEDNEMNRLTEGDEQGNWMLKGVAWKSLHTGQVITKEVSEKNFTVRSASLETMKKAG